MKLAKPLLTLFLLSPFFLFCQEGGVTITPADGNFTRCFPDTLVTLKIIVPEDYAKVDSFALQWCLDCPFIKIKGSLNPANLTHRYTLSDLRENCSYDPSCNFMGVCFNARIFAYIPNKTTPDNNSFTITFLFPPEPDFVVPSTVCEKTLITFENRTCPSNDPSMTYWWDYGDGSADDTGMHLYQDTGLYKVTLTAMNPCDTVTKVKHIRALGLPVAEIALDQGNSERDTFCINEVIQLDGTVSTFATSYRWTISPKTYTIIGEDNEFSATPQIAFQNTGLYTFNLTVNNSCNVPSEAQRKILIIEAPDFRLEDQPDACDSLAYTPNPFNPDAHYFINGLETASFPIQLAASDSLYYVESRLDTDCGVLTRRDTFYVDALLGVHISFPPHDTVICLNSENLALEITGVEAAAGTWYRNGEPFSPPFIPNELGDFVLSFERGSGECKTKDEVLVRVDGINIDLEDIFICTDSGPFFILQDSLQGTFTSTDCPPCVSPDGWFDPDQMGAASDVSVTYTLTNAIGCSASKTISVVINQTDAGFAVEDSYCSGEPVAVDLSLVKGDQQVWTIDHNPSAGPPFFNLPSGNHLIGLSVQTSNCTDTLAQMIRIIAPPPVADIVADRISGCPPLPVTFSAGGNFDAEAEYNWIFNRFPGDTLSGATPPVQDFPNTGTEPMEIPVVLRVSNSCVETTDSLLMVISAIPLALAGTVLDKYCSGDTIQILNAGRGAIDTFEWHIPGRPISYDSMAPPLVVFTPAVKEIPYSLVVANACGRDTSVNVLTVQPTDARAGFHVGKLDFCVGDTVRITNLANTNEVRYNFGDATESLKEDPQHVYLQADVYQITQKAFGCGFDSTDQTIRVHPPPKALFVLPLETCLGTEITVENLSRQALVQTWSINGQEVTDQVTPNFTFDTTGTYTIGLEVTSIDGCRDRQDRQIQVGPPPSVQFAVPDTICAGAGFPVEFTTPADFSTCQWKIDGIEYTDGCDAVLEVTTPGNHLIELRVTNAVGCLQDASRSVFVRATPTAAFAYEMDFTCSPAVVFFNNQSTGAGGYFWSFGSGSQEGTREPSPTFVYQEGGQYQVELIAGLDGVCFDTTSQEITINQTPQVSYQLTDDRCFPTDEVIVELNNGADYFIEVTGLDNNYFQSGRDRYELQTAGDYQVQIVSPAGCDTSFVFTVPSFQEVLLELMEDTTILFGQSVIIQTILNTANMLLSWTPPETLNDPGIPEPIATPFENTRYILAAQRGHCVYRDTVVIKVNQEHILPFAPMAFSPNGDGINDRFTFFGGVGIESIESLEIFNRWGGQMFKVKNAALGDEQAGWNGTFNGNRLPVGVYVFQAKLRLVNGQIIPFLGDVTLVR